MDKIKSVLDEGSLNEIMGLFVGVSALIILVFILVLGMLCKRGEDE